MKMTPGRQGEPSDEQVEARVEPVGSKDVTATPSETESSLDAIRVFLTQEWTTTSHSRAPDTEPTTLQAHVAFWDSDNDGVIWPLDVFRGFRRLGFGYFVSTLALLTPLFFSYPTRLARSWAPDPRLRIYVDAIHQARHGSDTGVYDADGAFCAARFDALFARHAGDGAAALTLRQLAAMARRNRCAADPAGWAFAFMEWYTTWLLLARDGRVAKDDLRACYEGTIFDRMAEEWSARKGN